MTSEEIIRVANLTIELFGRHYRLGSLEEVHKQELLNHYYQRHGMQEPDPQEDDMWYTMAEKVR